MPTPGEATFSLPGDVFASSTSSFTLRAGRPVFTSHRRRGVRVISVYCPNGQAVGSEKYDYKLRWFAALRDLLLASVAFPGAFEPQPLAHCLASPGSAAPGPPAVLRAEASVGARGAAREVAEIGV